jgi:hypothetical protein
MRRLLLSALLTLVMLAVIGGLLWYGNVDRVAVLAAHFRLSYLIWYLLLLIGYEGIRGALWLVLIADLRLRVPLATQLFAFAAGEAVRFLPTGAYVQNVLLQRASGADLGRSAAATTIIIVGEIFVALVAVMALGVGSWSLWMRVAVVALAIAAALVLRRLLATDTAAGAPRRLPHHRLIGLIVDEWYRFREGTTALLHPRPLAETLVITGIYEFFAGADLYVVVRALGITEVNLWQTVAVNCFGLAFYVVLGSLEAAAAGAFIAIGVGKSAAITAILVNRVLGVSGTLLLAAILMLALQDQWGLLRRRPAAVLAEAPPSLEAGTP